MATEQPIQLSSAIAGADLSATTSQYLFVTLNSAGKLVTPTAGQAAVGVLQNRPKSGQSGNFMVLGITKVVYGGTVTLGAGPTYLTSDASGKAVAAVGNNAVNAIALEAGAANELHSVLLIRGGGTAAGVSNAVLSFSINLASIANGNVVTFTPGFAGTLKSASFVVNAPATTAAKLTTLTLQVAAVSVTGGVLALTSANCTPMGAEVKSTAVTAGGGFTAAQTIGVIASATTAFVEGSGTLLILVG